MITIKEYLGHNNSTQDGGTEMKSISYRHLLTVLLIFALVSVSFSSLKQDNTSACSNARCPGCLNGSPRNYEMLQPPAAFTSPSNLWSWMKLGFGAEGASSLPGSLDGTLKPHTGAVCFSHPVCNFPCNGQFNFGLEIHYNNHLEYYHVYNKNGATLLGPGWLMNVEMRLESHSSVPDRILFRDSTGDRHQFLPVEGEPYTWKSVEQMLFCATLEKNINGYIMTLKDGKTNLGFGIDGSVEWLEDRNGNRLEISYNANGLPSRLDVSHTISDLDDRHIEFSRYESYELNGQTVYRLTELSLPDNTKVYFEYETSGFYRLRKIGRASCRERV